MIIDTSALVAILHAEPDALNYAEAIEDASTRSMSAVTFAETAIVIDAGRDPIASRRVDDLIREARIAIEPVTEVQARLAREAYRDFGKGSGHRAGLTSAIAFPMRSAKQQASRSYSKAKTSRIPTLARRGPPANMQSAATVTAA